jgi:hypothetical protein
MITLHKDFKIMQQLNEGCPAWQWNSFLQPFFSASASSVITHLQWYRFHEIILPDIQAHHQ